MPLDPSPPPESPAAGYTTLLRRARESAPYQRFCRQHLGCALGQLSPLTATEVEALVQACPTGAGRRLFDLGAGNGGVAALLARRRRARVTAIDWATPSAHHEALAQETPGLRFEVADLRTLERPVGPVDGLLLVDVLALLDDPSRLLARWASWLSPGGRLIVLGHGYGSGASASATGNHGGVPQARLSATARTLQACGLEVLEIDFDRFERALWQRQQRLLRSMAMEFSASGDQILHQILLREAVQAATWSEARRSHRRLTVGVRRATG